MSDCWLSISRQDVLVPCMLGLWNGQQSDVCWCNAKNAVTWVQRAWVGPCSWYSTLEPRTPSASTPYRYGSSRCERATNDGYRATLSATFTLIPDPLSLTLSEVGAASLHTAGQRARRNWGRSHKHTGRLRISNVSLSRLPRSEFYAADRLNGISILHSIQSVSNSWTASV